VPTLDELLEEMWDGSLDELELIETNVRQAKKTLDDVTAKAHKTSDPIMVLKVEEASRQLGVALEQLKAFMEPLPDEEEEPAPKPKKKAKKVK
jgi:hypothetical protein